MKKIFALFAALALTASAFAVEIGKPAPDFSATDINGKTIKLSDYKGKIVVLESYNSDCPFCHNHYATGAMQELQRDLAAKNVVWLIVDSVNTKNFSYRTPEQARKELVDQKITATAWIDDHSGAVGHLYDMKTTPHMFVIAADGTLVYDGAIDDRPARRKIISAPPWMNCSPANPSPFHRPSPTAAASTTRIKYWDARQCVPTPFW